MPEIFMPILSALLPETLLLTYLTLSLLGYLPFLVSLPPIRTYTP